MNDLVPSAADRTGAGQPLRLLVVSHTYVEPTNREKWRALRDLAPDWAITVVTPEGWHDPEFGFRASPAEERGRLRFVPLPTFGRAAGRYLFITPRFISEIRRLAPQVIYVEAEPWSAAYLQIALLRWCVASRARLAGFSWWNTPRWSTPLRFPGSVAYTIGRNAADLLIVGNHDAAALHRQQGFTGEVVVIPQLGVDLVTHSPGPPNPDLAVHLRVASTFVIGFVGRLTVSKGVAGLLDAVAGLEHDSWKLLIIGDGPERTALSEQAIRLKIAERTVFVGSVPRDEMPKYMRLMDVLVLPSLESQWEQFGHVLIEAMACGVPVVGSTSGEIPWVIDDDRLIFPMADVAALRARIERLMDDPTFVADCRARGLERVRQSYSNAAVALQLLAAFAQLRQTRRRGARS